MSVVLGVLSVLIMPEMAGSLSRQRMVRSWQSGSLALTQDLLPSAQNVSLATSEVQVLETNDESEPDVSITI